MLEQKRRDGAVVKNPRMWIFLVILSTVFLGIGGVLAATMTGLWFGILGCFWLMLGATILITHHVSQRFLAVVDKVDGVELRLEELRKLVEGLRG